MKMLNNKVLIKKIEIENKTSSGIILTKESEERFIRGLVVECPCDIKDIKKGDVVLIDKYKLVEVKIDEATHICDNNDIAAILEE